MKNPLHSSQYKRKWFRLPKLGWALAWVVLFVCFMAIAVLVGPLLLSQAIHENKIRTMLSQYEWAFLLVHGVFILSALWWWPAYIRKRGQAAGWPAPLIHRACQYKWGIVAVLGGLACVFFLGS